MRGGAFDRDIVQEGDRLGADADRVVHIHRHAIDPDRVVALEHLSDEHFAADTVRAQGEADIVPQIHDAGEIADIQGAMAWATSRAEVLRPVHPAEQRTQAEVGVIQDSGRAVAQRAIARHRVLPPLLYTTERRVILSRWRFHPVSR